MKRVHTGARPDWIQKAEEAGFSFHTPEGQEYWVEDTVYEFTAEEVAQGIEAPATEIHAMCREAADAIAGSEELMERLQIPAEHRDLVANSWRADDPELYGRLDLAFDGRSTKLIEYNADTPTLLFESAVFQQGWLEDALEAGRIPEGSRQFNRIRLEITRRFGEIFAPDTEIHFAAFGDIAEEYLTTETLAYAARDAEMGAHFTDVRDIGVTDGGQFADGEARVIGTLFKLYPWEDMLRDDFAGHIAVSRCRFLEPAWKAMISNKGLLPVLWRLFEGHPTLLPAFFADEVGAGSPAVDRAADALSVGIVRKPVFSRQGASITIEKDGRAIETAEERSYDAHPMIVQAYADLPVFDGMRPIVGAWIIGRACAGLCLREDAARITNDNSPFKTHYIRA